MPEQHTVPSVPVWRSRIDTPTDATFLALSSSVKDDEPITRFDIMGSIAHVAGLHEAGLLTRDEATALVCGLQEIAREHEAGTWRLDGALEDVHMNLEHALQERLGEVAWKLHTGRSRNDQVATATTLYVRDALAGLAQALHGLEEALAASAALHTETPWTARTHGQVAQPATLGFLLAAHAARCAEANASVSTAFHAIGTCALGAGAVAGSTLPLRAETPARLLGLAPLENALLATGTRDACLLAVHTAALVGPVAAGLATDLLALQHHGQYVPPASHTTGSSLMPHKQNPDALELVRAHGKQLIAHAVAVHSIVAGLGLGYHRDLQTTKAPTLRALRETTQIIHVLTAHIAAQRFHAPPTLPEPASGVGATDAAEALVLSGIPFRAAYRLVASAAQQSKEPGVDLATTLDATLQAACIDAATIEQAVAALTGDATRRTTRGGAAPVQVTASLQRLAATRQARTAQLRAMQQAIAVPTALLDESAHHILSTHHEPGDAT